MCANCEYANEVITAVFDVLVGGEDISILGPHHPEDVRRVIEAFNDALSVLHATACIGASILGTDGARLEPHDASIAFDDDIRAMERADDERNAPPMTDAEVQALLDDFRAAEPGDFL